WPPFGKSGGRKTCTLREGGSSPWADRTPVGSRTRGRRIAGREQHRQLVRGEPLGSLTRLGRPPRETSLGEPLVAQPEPLAVIHQHLQGCRFAIAEDEDGAGEGVFVKGLLAQPRQAVDAATEVGRLDGHQDLHLRGDLQHYGASQKRRAKASTSAAS